MTDTDPLRDARAQLRDLMEAARAGTLIPVRLPAQLEAIARCLDALPAAPEPAGPAPESAAPAPDVAEVRAGDARFVSHAVHDLRNPLTSIRGYADMLANPIMGPLNDNQKQFVDTVRTNARRMEGLLTDVSDMAKIRGETLKIALKLDTFKNIALMVEKQARPLAEASGRALAFDIPAGLPLLNVDGELLAKALGKLVENAIRYTPAEGGVVTVRAENQDGKLVVRVQDNGFGMSPGELAQLGTVYFRSERDEVREYKGSGLGIPVAYGIVRLLGGTVSVDSAPGAGTTFTVVFPGLSEKDA